jgi:pimeloyl-ACP methyl ester carboxylesterase
MVRSDLVRVGIDRMIDLPDRGGSVHALEFGPTDRPVDLVFVHANGFNAGTYRSILAPLSETYRILAYDQRGHGLSTLPAMPEPRSDWSDLSGDLIALLDVLDLNSVVIAGHSMGGTSGLVASAARPNRVCGLVMFDPVMMDRDSIRKGQIEGAAQLAWDSQPMVLAARKRRAVFPDKASVIASYTGKGAFQTWPARILADYVEAGFVADPDGGVRLACDPGWEASSFGAHGQDTWAPRMLVQCPVRILLAEFGSTCRIGDGVEFFGGFKSVTHETIAGTSHFLPMERPDLVERELRAALGN